jgi:hypothetical protein
MKASRLIFTLLLASSVVRQEWLPVYEPKKTKAKSPNREIRTCNN